MLRVIDLKSGYGNLLVISGITFSLSKGEIVAIIGPNGAGKSTFMTIQLAKLRGYNPEIVLCGGQIPTPGYIAKSFGIIGWNVPLWGTGAAIDPTTVNIGGEHAEGFFVTAGIAFDDLKPGLQAELGKSWKALTGQTLSLGGFYGASSAEVLIEALSKMAKAGDINRQRVHDTMQNMEIDISAGKFVYTPTSHEGGTRDCVTLVRIRNGKFLRWEKPKAIRNRNEW